MLPVWSHHSPVYSIHSIIHVGHSSSVGASVKITNPLSGMPYLTCGTGFLLYVGTGSLLSSPSSFASSCSDPVPLGVPHGVFHCRLKTFLYSVFPSTAIYPVLKLLSKYSTTHCFGSHWRRNIGKCGRYSTVFIYCPTYLLIQRWTAWISAGFLRSKPK